MANSWTETEAIPQRLSCAAYRDFAEPKWVASARAATGPTWRMLRATRMRHRSLVFASSSSDSSFAAAEDGTESSSPANSNASGAKAGSALLPDFFRFLR